METEIDLFEQYELQPKELSLITDKWGEKASRGLTYDDCAKFLNEVETVGFTFEYGLDGDPHSLRPMTSKEIDWLREHNENQKPILNSILDLFKENKHSEASKLINEQIKIGNNYLSHSSRSYIIQSDISNENKAFIISKLTDEKSSSILKEITNSKPITKNNQDNTKQITR